MKLRNFKKYALALGFIGINVAKAESMSETTGFAMDTNFGLDISAISNTNVSGGVGFQAALRPEYFFHKNIGVFAGVDYAIRNMELNSSSKISWLEIPFGMLFRYSLNANMVNSIGLGLYWAKNLSSSFNDLSGNYDLQGGLGFILTTSTLFPISENFALGINVDLKYGFFSPLKVLTTSKTLSLDIGIGSRLQF